MIFQYHPDLLARFPLVTGGVIRASGLTNGPTPEPLRQAYLAEQQAALARFGSTPLSEIESLAAWRSAFRGFGVEPTQYRNAAEALLRRLTKKGDIPSINTLVDAANLVSIRCGLPVAVFDTQALQGAVTVCFASGAERFIDLGSSAVDHPDPGEVIFSDPTGRVIARRWCWRQSDDSAARDATREAILTVEAQHAGGRSAVESALADLLHRLRQYAGGEYRSAVLDTANPGFQP